MTAKSANALEMPVCATALDVRLGKASSREEAERILLDDLIRQQRYYAAGGRTYSMEEVDRAAQEILDAD